LLCLILIIGIYKSIVVVRCWNSMFGIYGCVLEFVLGFGILFVICDLVIVLCFMYLVLCYFYDLLKCVCYSFVKYSFM